MTENPVLTSTKSDEEVNNHTQGIDTSETNIDIDSQEGENWLPERENEPEFQPHSGTDGSGDIIKTLEGDDCPLKVVEVVERFKQQTKLRLKDDTAEQYVHAFERFAKSVDLESYTRRQLAGPKARMMILTHLDKLPKPSWRWTVATLKAVWTIGLNIPWPLDPKRDLGRLPPTRRRESPPDEAVKAWGDALVHEADPYLRLLWLLVAQHGWRPSHVGRLKWYHVRPDSAGRPVAIVADGTEAGFKTSAPLAVRLTPDVVEALEAWRRAAPEVLPERPVLPWRTSTGRIAPSRENGADSLRVHWNRLRAKWRLPALRAVDVRHWVATACRRAGLSKQASAYLMGHDPTAGGAMRDWYDNPQLQDVFDEQAARLPYGPLGLLDPPTVELEGGLSKEVVSLVSAYLAGQTGTMEFATTMEKVRLQRSTQQTPAMET